jgi:glycosyltransferase involved in cell wall biosynthesis
MTFHRSLNFESARFRDRVRNALANGLSGAIVTGSRERQRHFVQTNFVQRRKVLRIPFGINLNRFQPDPISRALIRKSLNLSPDTFIIGAIGHFGVEKGIDVIIRGFQKLLAETMPLSVALVVLGSGTREQNERMSALARAIPAIPILFAGFECNVQRWLQAFDLFVHAPRLEAFGLVLLEAMATRLPVIATKVGGIPDIVQEGKTGLLVDPNAPNQLADAMRYLIDNPCLRDSLAEQGLQSARAKYSADQYALRYLNVYHALVDRQPPKGVDQEENPNQESLDSEPFKSTSRNGLEHDIYSYNPEA